MPKTIVCATAYALIAATLTACGSPPRQQAADPSVPNFFQTYRFVRHRWRAKSMAHRIHPGMAEADVVNLCGQPYQRQLRYSPVPPDARDEPQFQDMFCGRDAPLYVVFRDTDGGKSPSNKTVAGWISLHQVDLGDPFPGCFNPMPAEPAKHLPHPQ